MPIKPEIAQSPIMDVPPGRGIPPPIMLPEYRIYLLNKRLQDASIDCDNLWWDGLTSEFFEDNATLSISIYMEGPKHFTLGRTLIPRFFRSIFDGGAMELYFVTRHSKEMFNHSTHSVSMDCAQATMMTHYSKPVLTKVCTDGHLVIEFSYDELMRIRAWHFEILGHSELIPKQLAMQGPEVIEKFGSNITKRGLTSSTINYLKLCVILEPMKEIMSRQKAYNIDPRDCLRNCLFQKWQRMMNPPEPMRGTKRPHGKRKHSTTNSSNQMPNKKKGFPTSGVMIVGEPALMGGEFGEEDERMITRLENQFEQGSDGIKTENPDPSAASFPHTTSPAVRPNSNAMSPWQQGQMPPAPTQPPPQQRPPSQAGANGPIPQPMQQPPPSGPGSQNPQDNPGQDLPTTPISAPN